VPKNKRKSCLTKISNNYYILLTFDVEDWFQVENFKEYILLLLAKL